ncbi:MAG: LytTR family DNA-binding domain-containing protein [Clostridia bacterium]|nr:LytTR family DNA-binding domain-containing protein [Clostridia bacterium]
MKIAILDDEPLENRRLRALIEDYVAQKDYDIRVDDFTSGKELLKQPRYDLYFLDYKMDEMDGIAAAKALRDKFNQAVTVCYLTNYDGAAEEIINNRVYADGFLRKPADREKLCEKLDTFYKMSYFTRVELRTGTGFETIYAQELIWAEADNKRVRLNLSDREETFNYLLGDLEKLLEPCGLFCRIHRSFIVNMLYVRRYDASRVILKNGAELPLKNCGFKETYQNFIFSRQELT